MEVQPSKMMMKMHPSNELLITANWIDFTFIIKNQCNIKGVFYYVRYMSISFIMVFAFAERYIAEIYFTDFNNFLTNTKTFTYLIIYVKYRIAALYFT